MRPNLSARTPTSHLTCICDLILFVKCKEWISFKIAKTPRAKESNGHLISGG